MYYRYLYRSFLVLFCLLVFPAVSVAETRIVVSPPYETNIWTTDGSPYILETDVDIVKDTHLIIEPGVVVMSASTTEEQEPHTIWSRGTLEMRGSEDNPVRIVGLGNIFVRGTTTMAHTHFDNTGLSLTLATATIVSGTFTGNDIGIEARNSKIDISRSEFIDNNTAIYSAKWSSSPVQLVREVVADEYGIGGEGNAMGNDPTQNHITVHDSIFENNVDYAIINIVANVIDATDNWWGNPLGPESGIVGPVSAEPWRTEDPRIKKVSCCSNVLFLPGLEASRLDITDNRLWEPNRKEDVKKLSLDSSGKSLRTGIYTAGVIDSVFGMSGIYEKFIATMNSVVAEKIINEWVPFAYDWRMGALENVTASTSQATTTKILIEEVVRLAEKSKTGKITIIAHSKGGLVAKMLGKELEKRGQSEIIDKVVFVAVPELGTPQAVAALLHGTDQALGKGFIVDAATMRSFGLNMLGAYDLLPSSEFFNRITDPIITFAGKSVGSYKSFKDFLTGQSDKRKQPIESDLKTAAVLSTSLLSKAESLHFLIDDWRFPTTTEVISLAGWGSPTTKSIDYSADSPRIRKNPDGDGTVLTKSAVAYGGDYGLNNIYFNLDLFNSSPTQIFSPINHSDIMEAKPITDFLKQIVAKSSGSQGASPLPIFLTYEKPKFDATSRSWLMASVHSPVDMDIYDSKGRHMGFIPIPGDPDSDIRYFENTIGGTYDMIGDEKYFTVPANDTYTVKLKGTGTGNFTFQVQKLVGNDMTEVSNSVYVDLPVTPLLAATTTISGLVTTAPLELDVDGNGTTDFRTSPRVKANPLLHLDAMKTIILSFHLRPTLEKQFLTRIERIRKLIEKDKQGRAEKRIKAIVERMNRSHWGIKKLTDIQKQSILEGFNRLLADLETL